MLDRFLLTPSPTPKFDKGNLAERHGLPVPQRYNFDRAVASGRSFIARSEHEQEYAGVSGLLESYPITPEKLVQAREFVADRYQNAREEIPFMTALQRRLNGGSDKEFATDLARLRSFPITLFSRYTGVSEKDFIDGVSYSCWELLGGHNRVVVADNAIAGRYHVFTQGRDATQRTRNNYTIVENGNIVVCQGDKVMNDAEELSEEGGIDKDFIITGAAELIAFYEQVRHLPGLDPAHCPIVECQTVAGLNYFLQVHRSRDVEPASFVLQRAAKEGEVEALFVRGATPPEGVVVDLGLYYPTFGRSFERVEKEDGGYDKHFDFVFSEVMARRRNVQLIAEPSLESLTVLTGGYHLSKSLLFKPGVSVVADVSVHLQKHRPKAQGKLQKTGLAHRIPVRVISDGRRALIKFLEG